MNYWLAQLILAARNSDDRDTGWMQILVFVALAVFYAVGSIIKAKANKTALKEEKQIPRKPGTKPAEGARAPKAFKKIPYQAVERPVGRTPKSQPRPQVAKPQVQPPRRKVARPQPAVGRKLPTKAILKPQVQPKLEELPEFTSETVKKDVRLSSVEALKAERVAMPAEIPQSEYLSEIVSDYEDPEKLRRAILHYEILGKPLSLRDPSEHII